MLSIFFSYYLSIPSSVNYDSINFLLNIFEISLLVVFLPVFFYPTINNG